MKKRFFAVFSLILTAVFLVACSSQSTGEKNWEKIEKRGSIKVATAGTLYPQTYHDDKNNLTGYDVEIPELSDSRTTIEVKEYLYGSERKNFLTFLLSSSSE